MTSPVSVQSRPTVKCKTCAKEFGKSSIKFHEPQCERKKNAEESRKDKEKNEGEEKTVSYIDHIGSYFESYNYYSVWDFFKYSV